MQGWGRGGGGVGGDPGPDSPSSLVAAEVGGGCPRLGRAVENILSPMDSTESPGNRPLGSERGWQDHPSPLGSL